MIIINFCKGVSLVQSNGSLFQIRLLPILLYILLFTVFDTDRIGILVGVPVLGTVYLRWILPSSLIDVYLP